MRVFRSLFNSALRQSLADPEGVATRIAPKLLSGLTIALTPILPAVSRHLRQPGVLTTLRLIGAAIAETPYGEPLRLPAPLILTVAVTDTCDQPCTYCTASLRPSHRATHLRVDDPVWRDILHSNIPFLFLTGGEPFASPFLFDLLRSVFSKDKAVFVFTHATARSISPCAREFGMRLTFVLSLYGNEHEHDARRGAGSFASTIDAAKAISEAGGRFMLNCVADADTLGGLDALTNRDLGVRPCRIVVTRVIRAGRGALRTQTLPAQISDLHHASLHAARALNVSVQWSLPEEAAETRKLPFATQCALRLLGISMWKGCSAGNWAMHMASTGQPHMCAVAESYAKNASTQRKTLLHHWRTIQAERYDRSGGCLVERRKTSGVQTLTINGATSHA